MKVFYRISSNSYPKHHLKVNNATKKNCLLNLLEHFPAEEVIVMQDHCDTSLLNFLFELLTDNKISDLIPIGDNIHPHYGSSAQSSRTAYEFALDLPEDEVVYLVEDDYIHRQGIRQVLLEGSQLERYCTGYLCPDKVELEDGICPWPNPYVIGNKGEVTKVMRTKSTYWMITNSTTMTFCSTVKYLKEDYLTWKKWCWVDDQQTHPNDFQCFIDLYEQGKHLVSSIPAYSTHSEKLWLAYDYDWNEILMERK